MSRRRLTNKSRCQAESNCCAWFCRPLPNHSAIAPYFKYPVLKTDCKYRNFFRKYKTYFLNLVFSFPKPQ